MYFQFIGSAHLSVTAGKLKEPKAQSPLLAQAPPVWSRDYLFVKFAEDIFASIYWTTVSFHADFPSGILLLVFDGTGETVGKTGDPIKGKLLGGGVTGTRLVHLGGKFMWSQLCLH